MTRGMLVGVLAAAATMAYPMESRAAGVVRVGIIFEAVVFLGDTLQETMAKKELEVCGEGQLICRGSVDVKGAVAGGLHVVPTTADLIQCKLGALQGAARQ